MKRTFILFTLLAVVPVTTAAFFGGLFGSSDSPEVATSVEFNIAEPSPEGLGYAMPASGSSGIAKDTPGCSISVDKSAVVVGETVRVSWRHGAVAGYNGSSVEGSANPVLIGNLQGYGGSGWYSSSMSYKSNVSGRSCVAFCDIEGGTCSLDSTNRWDGLVDVVNGGAGKAVTFIPGATTLNLAQRLAPIVLAGSGSSSYVCKGATEETGWSDVKITSKFGTGILKIGLKTNYKDDYGSHHDRSQVRGCYTYLAISPDDNAEVVPDVPIIGTIVPVGDSDKIAGIIQNIGTVATNYRPRDDGKVNYSIRIDTNNNGSWDHTFGSGILLAPVAAMSSSQVNHTLPAVLPVGVHKVSMCVNKDPRLFKELTDSNNCIEGTFQVAAADLQAYIFRSYALYGGPTRIGGFVLNRGESTINSAFSSDFDVETATGNNRTVVSAPDHNGSLITSMGGIEVLSNLFDFSTVFGTEKNLRFRLWTDTKNTVVETVDNVRPDESGNNDSDWYTLTLVNPDISVQPADLNGSSDGFWGPYLYTATKEVAFDLVNRTAHALDIEIPFQSIIAFDTTGDCTDSSTYSDPCVEQEATIHNSFVTADSLARARAALTSNYIGEARARIYADVNDDLDETDESNNISAWIPFSLVESLSGDSVELIPDKNAVRNGETVTFTWNLNGRPESECRILQNFTKTLLSPISGANLPATVTATSQYTLECDGNPVAGYEAARDTVTITALSSYFET